MFTLPRLLLLVPAAAVGLTGFTSAQYDVDADLVPLASCAEGNVTFQLFQNVARWTYSGSDEVLIYALDLDDPDVASGLLEIVEESLGVRPVAEAGLTFRDGSGSVLTPTQLAGAATLVDSKVDGKTLHLTYDDGGSHQRCTSIRMVGKALEIRCYDPNGDTSGLDNYAGFTFGNVRDAGSPKDLRIPSMISTAAVTLFDTGSEKAYVSHQVNWIRSHGNEVAQPAGYDDIVSGTDWIDNSYEVIYNPLNDGELAAPVDETVWIVVTRFLEDTFPSTEAKASPYRTTLASRPTALMSRGGNTDWSGYAAELRDFEKFGMDLMATYYFFWWGHLQPQAGNTIQHFTQVWYPAKDEPGFLPSVSGTPMELTLAYGFLAGLYTLYSPGPADPFYEPTDRLVESDGSVDSLRMSTSRMIGHADREEGLIRTNYETSLGFGDIMGHRHPGVPNPPNDKIYLDHDAAQPDKAKTIGDGIRDIRRLFLRMRDIHEGPTLSEGATEHLHQTYGLLYAGFVDSMEAAIQTGADKLAEEFMPGEDLSLAPEHWWVLPDYALRVLHPVQANHGNSFYNRFFTGPGVYPLSRAREDRYRLYEITYGKTAFFKTNGGASATFLNRAAEIREYYMMQALQEAYMNAAVSEIVYWDSSAFVSADDLIKATTEAVPLDAFRDPRIRITYDDGLVVYVNHDTDTPGNWAVTAAGVDFDIPGDGFVAHRPDGLLVFSAIPDGVAGRIDYAFCPDRYELLDSRANPGSVAWGALTSTGGIRVINHVRNIFLSQPNPSPNTIVVTELGAPGLVSIELADAPAAIATDRPERLVPEATYSNGARQEVSYLLGSFSSTDPAVLDVNRAGVAEGLARGTATVDFTGPGAVTSAPATIKVYGPDRSPTAVTLAFYDKSLGDLEVISGDPAVIGTRLVADEAAHMALDDRVYDDPAVLTRVEMPGMAAGAVIAYSLRTVREDADVWDNDGHVVVSMEAIDDSGNGNHSVVEVWASDGASWSQLTSVEATSDPRTSAVSFHARLEGQTVRVWLDDVLVVNLVDDPGIVVQPGFTGIALDQPGWQGTGAIKLENVLAREADEFVDIAFDEDGHPWMSVLQPGFLPNFDAQTFFFHINEFDLDFNQYVNAVLPVMPIFDQGAHHYLAGSRNALFSKDDVVGFSYDGDYEGERFGN